MSCPAVDYVRFSDRTQKQRHSEIAMLTVDKSLSKVILLKAPQELHLDNTSCLMMIVCCATCQSMHHFAVPLPITLWKRRERRGVGGRWWREVETSKTFCRGFQIPCRSSQLLLICSKLMWHLDHSCQPTIIVKI